VSLAKLITDWHCGEWRGDHGVLPGPGLGPDDRSVTVRDTPDGDDVRITCAAGMDWKAIKDDWRISGFLPGGADVATVARHNTRQALAALGAEFLDKTPALDDLVAAAKASAPPLSVSGLDLIDVGQWHGQPVPVREWIVPGWILPRAVTLIAGAGATGKSLLIQQWLSAISVGDVFMDQRGTAPVPVLYVNCEDDLEELKRRQHAIAKAFDRQLCDYGGRVQLVARLGMDNPLGVIGDDGKYKPSDFYREIRSAALKMGAKVIALDNAMQLYVGNLNDPREVTVFCNALSRMALDTGAAVILAGHVAKTDGSEFSGTMAWENAVRMRLFLKRESDKDGKEIEDSDRRILTRSKANTARKGQQLTMVWHEGAFYCERDVAAADGRDAVNEAAFLRCLDRATEQRRHVSHSPAAPGNYAPVLFATMPEAAGIGKKALEVAMNRLFASGDIIAREELWRDEKNRRQVYGIARANPRANPAQTPAKTPQEPRKNPAQTCAHTPPVTTLHPGGALGAPAGPEAHLAGDDLPPGDWVPEHWPDQDDA
jgi:RecA-family ATPase